ncbi:hypothetical protein ACFP47_10080 [Nesterenkonia lacusekhoensis]|uniref:Holin n=1 Tax=Nesterenkonia lacusekhoensis TaxID=150832 RepID=A0ABS4T507_9MICC|nr:hypothetical protein [Nesterenkonia lacusekhoensis]MBP2319548.1 hypothetical protein [Nesterenkonia lacusekhoensis]
MAQKKHTLAKVPRAVLYAVGGAAILALVAAVIAELYAPGSIQRVREATEIAVTEFGVILTAVAALVPPVLALLNLTDDEPANPLDEYDPEEVIDQP